MEVLVGWLVQLAVRNPMSPFEDSRRMVRPVAFTSISQMDKWVKFPGFPSAVFDQPPHRLLNVVLDGLDLSFSLSLHSHDEATRVQYAVVVRTPQCPPPAVAAVRGDKHVWVLRRRERVPNRAFRGEGGNTARRHSHVVAARVSSRRCARQIP